MKQHSKNVLTMIVIVLVVVAIFYYVISRTNLMKRQPAYQTEQVTITDKEVIMPNTPVEE